MKWEKLISFIQKASPLMTVWCGVWFLISVAQFLLVPALIDGVCLLVWADIWKDYTEEKNDGKMDSKPTGPLE